MNILVLEDDVEVGSMYKTVFEDYKYFKCTICDNIIDFDYYLYSSKEKFDYYIIDLALESPDISPAVLKKWCDEQEIEPKTKINNRIPLIGWDYFIQKIVINDKTKNILKNFILISGFKDALEKQVQRDEFNKAENIFAKSNDDLSNNIISIIKEK